MKRPSIKDDKVKSYVTDLERQLDNFKSGRTAVKLYLGVKKQLDDMADFLISDIEVELDNGKVEMVSIMDYKTLSSKDDKFIDRYLKILEKFNGYIKDLKEAEEQLNPEILKSEEKKFVHKTGMSVEEMMRSNGGS